MGLLSDAPVNKLGTPMDTLSAFLADKYPLGWFMCCISFEFAMLLESHCESKDKL